MAEVNQKWPFVSSKLFRLCEDYIRSINEVDSAELSAVLGYDESRQGVRKSREHMDTAFNTLRAELTEAGFMLGSLTLEAKAFGVAYGILAAVGSLKDRLSGRVETLDDETIVSEETDTDVLWERIWKAEASDDSPI